MPPRRLGQHFLVDDDVVGRIVAARASAAVSWLSRWDRGTAPSPTPLRERLNG